MTEMPTGPRTDRTDLATVTYVHGAGPATDASPLPAAPALGGTTETTDRAEVVESARRVLEGRVTPGPVDLEKVADLEVDLDALPLPGVPVTPTISSYPPALIDVALIVDAATPADEVRRALVEGAGELLESLRLFDVYTGAQVGDGRKSLAYKLTFRAPDRTLTVEEAVAARDAAVAVAASRFGAVLRGA